MSRCCSQNIFEFNIEFGTGATRRSGLNRGGENEGGPPTVAAVSSSERYPLPPFGTFTSSLRYNAKHYVMHTDFKTLISFHLRGKRYTERPRYDADTRTSSRYSVSYRWVGLGRPLRVQPAAILVRDIERESSPTRYRYQKQNQIDVRTIPIFDIRCLVCSCIDGISKENRVRHDTGIKRKIKSIFVRFRYSIFDTWCSCIDGMYIER